MKIEASLPYPKRLTSSAVRGKGCVRPAARTLGSPGGRKLSVRPNVMPRTERHGDVGVILDAKPLPRDLTAPRRAYLDQVWARLIANHDRQQAEIERAV